MYYSGFVKRLGAFILDIAIIYIVSNIAMLVLGISMGLSSEEANEAFMAKAETLFFWITILIPWIYQAGMESSRTQATLGKIALRIQVTSTDGERISFIRATVRHFGMYLSSIILFIGFIMIAFTERKQGLHDLIARCLVVDKVDGIGASATQSTADTTVCPPVA